MRKKKHSAERIAACSAYLIKAEPGKTIDAENAFSDNSKELHLEIGCGKGGFACGMAAAHPDVNFIAMERVADVACLALEKAAACADDRPDNLRFLIADARGLTELFPPHSIDCIYLNFSDPWPKSGYFKRRLTYRTFLEQYRVLLKEGGLLRFKTDNAGLFEFSLEEFAAVGLHILWQTDDLHASPYNEGNVMTEYEKNFSEQGMPIHAALVQF
jgi:tRNA (guanine-N7-)-methyltransferase